MIFEQPSKVEGQIMGQQTVAQQLEHFSSLESMGCLIIKAPEVIWTLYFNAGKLTYASHSLDPAGRLDRHLRKLNQDIPALTKEVRARVHQQLNNLNKNPEDIGPEVQTISDLIEQKSLTEQQAAILVNHLIQEVVESCLLLPEGTYCFYPDKKLPCAFTQVDVASLLLQCQKRFKLWKSLAPQVWSPYQRPYFFSQNVSQDKLPDEKAKQLGRLLKGFCFRDLSVLLKGDELILAANIYPLIVNQTILVRPPQAPFDLLPDLRNYSLHEIESLLPQPNADSETGDTPSGSLKSYRIACVDDNPSTLDMIQSYLESDSLSIIQMSQPLRALLEIMDAKPDLILMNVRMTKIDGYDVCRMLRKHSNFQAIPIILWTDSTSLIDRAKTKLAGATDYITKPFTQKALTKIVFQYLT